MFRNLRYLIFPVLNITGIVLMAFSGLTLIPIALSYYFQDNATYGFELGFGTCFLTGLLLLGLTRKDKRELLPRDGFLMATIIWIFIPLFASVPLLISIPDATFSKAFFEAISGTTTTCGTVFNGLDSLAPSINFWRCFLSWLGGMGILVLAVAILPLLGVGGAQIFRAEASGPNKEAKLTPRIADTAKGLWWIYFILTLACSTAYYLAGMSPFDAIIHSFTTVSLGGFSSHDLSFAYWNNPHIEAVCIFFMLICALSFSLHFIALKKLSLRVYITDSETRAWFATVFMLVVIISFLVSKTGIYESIPETFRYTIFNVVSIISTTGFSTTDYGQWPLTVSILMLFCASFATCGGSTGGGIKMMRAILLGKQLGRGLMQTMHPNAIVPLRLQSKIISDKLAFAVLNYVLLWLFTATVATISFLLTGLDPLTAVSTSLACITNTGPGLGSVGPAFNYGHFSSLQLWLCSFCMLVGRLELMTVFVLLTRAFWRI